MQFNFLTRNIRLFRFSLFGLLLIFSYPATGQINRQPDSLMVTYFSTERQSSKDSNKLKKARLQLRKTETHLSLEATQLSSLPKKVKQVTLIQRLPDGEIKTKKFKRAAIWTRLTKDQLNLFEIDSVSKREGKISRAQYQKDVGKFMSGKYAGIRLTNQWLTLAEDSVSADVEVSAKLRIGWFKSNTLQTINIPQRIPVGYPAIDANPCKPFNRFYERKKLLGYGIDKMRYKPFHLSNRKVTRKNFTVYFQKNSSEAEQESLQQMIDYLQENNLSVVEIRVEAFASVEGDSLNNYLLQNKRAQRVVSLLQKKNNEYIHLDTVIVSEAWQEFRQAIEKTSFGWMDTLDHEQIRSLLANDAHLLEQLEPILKPQRRATMKIVTARKLSHDEMIEAIEKRLYELGMKLLPRLNRARDFSETEAQVLGVYQYFDKLIDDGKASFTDLATMVDTNPASAQMKILLFYHFIRKIEQNEFDKDVPLDSVFSKRKWNNLFYVANSSIIELVATDPPELRRNRIRQAVDIQFYTTKYIEEGILDPQILCTFDYPHQKLFYGLKLQHYALLHSLSESHDLMCFKRGSANTDVSVIKPFQETDFNDFINTHKTDSLIATRKEASFDSSPKGDYYYFIRTLFVNNDRAIQDFVNTSDNMIEFDLLHLLKLNVDGWNPVANHYYDSAIQFIQMEKLVRKLRSMDNRICDQTVHQLYLDFYHKALLHIEYYFRPGDRVFVAIADESLKFISEYYSARSHLVFRQLAEYLGDAFNSYYWLPSRVASPVYGYRFFKSMAPRIPVDGPLHQRLEKYQTIYGK